MEKTGEKTKKREWLFWIVIPLFVALAIYCFVVGMVDKDKAPWFMASFTILVALFTFLLWGTTKKYAKTTKELLDQSKEVLKQSRISFLVSIVERTIDHLKREEDLYKHEQAQAVAYIEGKTKGINRISKEGALEFLDAMIDWSRERGSYKNEVRRI